MIGGITELDKKGDEAQPVLRDLGSLLLQNKTPDLAAKRDSLERLANEAQLPLSRQMGYAALVSADQSTDKSWPQVEGNSAKLTDLLLALPLIRDIRLRAAFYPKVEPLLHQAEAPEVRRAAITAVTALPGHDGETFNTLAGLMTAGTERAAASPASSASRVKPGPKTRRNHWSKA